jgi:Protein of unknown function (DUF935)
LDVASRYRGGNTAGVALPFGSTFELAGIKGATIGDFVRQAIEYHDKQMALAALAHFLNLDRGGSYALASVQESTFSQGVQQVADDIRDTAQAHVIEDLVDVNWGPDEPCPLLTIDEIGSQQDATAASLQMLVGAGLLTPDPQLEAFERQQMGLPPVDPKLQVENPNQFPLPDPPPAETEPTATPLPALPWRGAANASSFGAHPTVIAGRAQLAQEKAIRAANAARRGGRGPISIDREGQITLW